MYVDEDIAAFNCSEACTVLEVKSLEEDQVGGEPRNTRGVERLQLLIGVPNVRHVHLMENALDERVHLILTWTQHRSLVSGDTVL